MICQGCGSPVPEGMRFCGRCGREVVFSGPVDAEALLRRAELFLEDEDWIGADDQCEKVLDVQPENARAYLIKLMARLKLKKEEGLAQASVSYGDWHSYRNALRFADDGLRERLEAYLESTEESIRLREAERLVREEAQRLEEEQKRIATIYWEACQLQRKDHGKAAQMFEKIAGYEDAAERARECRRLLQEKQKRDAQLQLEIQLAQEREERAKKVKMAVAALAVILVVVVLVVSVMSVNGERARKIQQELVGMEFHGSYKEFGDYVSAGSWGTYGEMTEYEITYRFLEDGRVEVDTIKRYDQEPFITYDGVQAWDSWDEYSNTVSYSGVQIPLFGDITVTIGGQRFVLTVDPNEVPVSLTSDDATFRVDG